MRRRRAVSTQTSALMSRPSHPAERSPTPAAARAPCTPAGVFTDRVRKETRRARTISALLVRSDRRAPCSRASARALSHFTQTELGVKLETASRGICASGPFFVSQQRHKNNNKKYNNNEKNLATFRSAGETAARVSSSSLV